MSINFNGTVIPESTPSPLIFDNQLVTKVIFNDNTVYENHLKYILTDPNNYTDSNNYFGVPTCDTDTLTIISSYNEGNIYTGCVYLFSKATGGLINTITPPILNTYQTFGIHISANTNYLAIVAFNKISNRYTLLLYNITNPNMVSLISSVERDFINSITVTQDNTVIMGYNYNISGYAQSFIPKIDILNSSLSLINIITPPHFNINSSNSQNARIVSSSIFGNGNTIIVGYSDYVQGVNYLTILNKQGTILKDFIDNTYYYLASNNQYIYISRGSAELIDIYDLNGNFIKSVYNTLAGSTYFGRGIVATDNNVIVSYLPISSGNTVYASVYNTNMSIKLYDISYNSTYPIYPFYFEVQKSQSNTSVSLNFRAGSGITSSKILTYQL